MNSPRDPLSRICAIAVDDGLPLDVQMEAIRICLPYLHPRLSAMASVTVKTENRDPSAILAKLQNAMRAAVTDTAPDAQLIEAQAEPVAA